MEDNYHVQNCNDSDVLAFNDNTCKISKFRRAVEKSFGPEIGRTLSSNLASHGVNIEQAVLLPNGSHQEYSRWFTEGIECEILNLGSNSWKKARVKIQFGVEFYIEEQEAVETIDKNKPDGNSLETSLDDIRRMINESC